jgi:acyl carrier protein phosphodiesterase
VNYLAHLLLAGDRPDVLVGSLLGDFLRGPIPVSLPPDIALGVRLHRAVDAYTDHHPMFRRSVARTPVPWRRYGPIIVDVYYDHLLARDWALHHPDPLEDFAGRSYALLVSRLPALPAQARAPVSRVVDADLLVAYRQFSTVQSALRRIGTRLRRPRDLAAALPELRRQERGLEEDFQIFFPALRARSEALLRDWLLPD